MQQTIFAILTDEQARNADAVEVSLDKEFAAGAPWFFKRDLDQIETSA